MTPLCFAIPFIVLAWLVKRRGAKIAPFLVGCAVFVLFALVLEGAVNYVFSKTETGKKVLENGWFYALYGGLMAGIFEETGRFIAFKTVLRRYRDNDANALSYGAGHGGCEAILTVGTTYLVYIAYALLINSGNSEVITGSLPAGQEELLTPVFEQLAATPAWQYIAALGERCLAIILHMSLSVLVWFAAKKKEKFLLFPAAILLHAAVDAASAAAVKVFELPVLTVEGILAVCTLIVALIARAVWRRNAE